MTDYTPVYRDALQYSIHERDMLRAEVDAIRERFNVLVDLVVAVRCDVPNLLKEDILERLDEVVRAAS